MDAVNASVRQSPMLVKGLAGVGALTLTVAVYKLYNALRYLTHRSQLDRYLHSAKATGPQANSTSDTTNKQHPWALITGVTAGLGREFASQVAAAGFNVVLHGRNATALQTVLSELQSQHPSRSFKLLIIDAANPGPDFQKTVTAILADLHLTVLINNLAGSLPTTPDLQYFTDFTPQDIDGWLDINFRFQAQLTRAVLPYLVASQPSLLIFISSAAGAFFSPKLALYTACKAATDAFAQTLDTENRMLKRDIEVKSLAPARVWTERGVYREDEKSWELAPVEDFVTACLGKVGWQRGRCGGARVVPWWGHWALLGGFGWFPAWVAEGLAVSKTLEVEKARGGKEE